MSLFRFRASENNNRNPDFRVQAKIWNAIAIFACKETKSNQYVAGGKTDPATPDTKKRTLARSVRRARGLLVLLRVS